MKGQLVHWVEAARAAHGAVLMAGPGGFRMVLGARHVAQAVVILTVHDHRAHAAGRFVDGLHLTTMLLLAVKSPRWRQLALRSAFVSACLAIGESVASARQ